jgi:hypothetical protein
MEKLGLHRVFYFKIFNHGNWFVRYLDVFVLIEIFFTQITLDTKNQGCGSL